LGGKTTKPACPAGRPPKGGLQVHKANLFEIST
jgi:hypothetical protein